MSGMGDEQSGRSVDREHSRPPGATDQEVEAAGKMSEGLEYIERARGHLYSLHQLVGQADFLFGDTADALAECGHAELASHLRTEVVGRNVLPGHWTFQMVEEFDDTYWSVIRAAEQKVREEVTGGRRHVYEAELKQQRRSHGVPGHEATPDDV